MASNEHCMINGERCSKCCEVLTINQGKNTRDWFKYVRNHGYPDDFASDNKIFNMLIEVSKRRAKKINPKLVSIINRAQSYFKCKNLTADGCSAYKDRPYMCSGYPRYGLSESEFLNSEKSEGQEKGLYIDDCTYYLELK